MTDQENTPEGLAGLVQLWIIQLHRMTEGWRAWPGSASLPCPGRCCRACRCPGAASAAQLDSVGRRVAAQRTSIAALQAQLAALDEQLAVLEGIFGPLAGWGKSWAQFEGLVLPARRDPAAGG